MADTRPNAAGFTDHSPFLCFTSPDESVGTEHPSEDLSSILSHTSPMTEGRPSPTAATANDMLGSASPCKPAFRSNEMSPSSHLSRTFSELSSSELNMQAPSLVESEPVTSVSAPLLSTDQLKTPTHSPHAPCPDPDDENDENAFLCCSSLKRQNLAVAPRLKTRSMPLTPEILSLFEVSSPVTPSLQSTTNL
eukprot:Rmarinus@m.4576